MPTKNLRSIDNIDTNDMNFKHLETTKDIIISPKNEYGDPQRPDVSHKWTAKVSDGTNYVGDYAVKISGASMVVDSEDFTKLPVGKYQLEIWEQWNDVDGTSQLSIYPSPQQTIPFTIYANITDQAGKGIKEIGFQDVVDQAVMNIGMNYVFKVNTIEPDQTATVVQAAADGKNYVTFNIPRGAKGDKGNKGDKGDKGDTGGSIWSMKMAVGGNVSGRWISDLYNASATNLPTVNDLVIQPDGNVFSVINVTKDSSGNYGGGGTFDLGATLFNIKGDKGDKGDTGTVDNAGLINAPAFQALQTQVNNSAVGTNLLIGTATPVSITGTNSYNQWSDTYALVGGMTAYALYQKYGSTFTLSYDWSVKDTASAYAGHMQEQFNASPWGVCDTSTMISSSNTSGHNVTTFTLANNSDNTATTLQIRLDSVPTTSTITVSNMKLEKGSVATDWCPNPTEVLTQADYAKIKAAIVALGGSLS